MCQSLKPINSIANLTQESNKKKRKKPAFSRGFRPHSRPCNR
nr:MAG TPA: hypothetical protein [Caudoviricetes sp.]